MRGRSEGDFETGIERGLQLILSDPEFIYRTESVPVEAIGNNQYYAISENELASRLSFFLWSSPPDAELLGLANAGQLRKSGVLEQQVERMSSQRRTRTTKTPCIPKQGDHHSCFMRQAKHTKRKQHCAFNLRRLQKYT
mgnify:CR=1 FL=1